MYTVKSPAILKPLAKDLVWKMSAGAQRIFLTFDDGPTPGVTDEALDILKAHQAKATFFCLGKNVAQHPELFARILLEGHTVGNHSYDHPDGWNTEHFYYLRNALQASKFISSELFRPPYGRITPAQVRALRSRYRIIMWHVLSADFDVKNSARQCLDNVIENSTDGSIVVFHDSLKAADRMLPALEGSLNALQKLGYSFQSISHESR